jgi:hypothetical protein
MRAAKSSCGCPLDLDVQHQPSKIAATQPKLHQVVGDARANGHLPRDRLELLVKRDRRHRPIDCRIQFRRGEGQATGQQVGQGALPGSIGPRAPPGDSRLLGHPAPPPPQV